MPFNLSTIDLEEMKWANIPDSLIVFDLETTGLNPKKDRILEIGAIRFVKDDYRKTGEVDSFQCFIKQSTPIPPKATEINGITDTMVKEGDNEAVAIKAFLEFAGETPLFAYNAEFDKEFLHEALKRNRMRCTSQQENVECILEFARDNLPEFVRNIPNFKLQTVCQSLDLKTQNTHRAVGDSLAALNVYIVLMQKLSARSTGEALAELERLREANAAIDKRLNQYSQKQEESYAGIVLVLLFIVLLVTYSVVR